MSDQPRLCVVSGDPSETPASVATLIHGTWARGTRWSEFEGSLRASLPAPALIQYFEWPDRNSILARARSAEALQHDLRTTFQQYPDAVHCVVAHSHGGTVLTKALGDAPDLQARVDAVVCMATPFIVAEQRKGANAMFLAAMWMFPVYCFLFFIFDLQHRHAQSSAILGSLILYGGLGSIWYATRMSHRTNPKVLAALDYGDLSALQDKFLIVRASLDEASLALTFVQAFSWLATLAWDVAYPVVFFIARIAFGSGRRIAASVLAYFVTPIVIIAFDTANVSLPLIVYLLLYTPFLLVGLAIFAFVPLSMLFPASAICLFPFGGVELMLNGPRLLLSAEPTPPGRWNFLQLAPLKNRRGLRHSTVHSAPEVMHAVSNWLSQTLNAGRDKGSNANPL